MTTTTDGYTIGWPVAQRLQRWARRVGLAGKLAIALAVAVAVSGLATYAAWTGSSTDAQDLQLVLGLLVVDMILLLSLGALIARQLVRLYVERRSGSAGSRLHTRFVGLFSLVAVAPAIIVAVFAALFFHFVIQAWFSDRIRNAVEGSQAIAQAYVAEHRKAIRADILAMANDLNRVAPRLARNAGLFNQVLSTQAALRTLSEATVFDSSGRVLARTTLSLAAAFDAVPLEAIGRVNSGEVVVFASDTEDQVRALMRLEGFLDAYLYVGRFVEHQVVSYVQQTQAAVAQYEMLEGARSSVQLMSALIFIIVALMLLFVAVWLGLLFANRLVRPISALVLAAERVRQGDMLARVPEGDSDDELGTLSRAFNRMTNQLEAQRNEVLEANRKLDRRRRFTETVLAGVSAGVVGLDRDGRINLPNQTAANLLGSDIDTLIGQRFENVVPELGLLLAEARGRPNRVVDGQVSLNRGDKRRTLLVRVTADRSREERQGFVITFDDITELLQAQRTAAWADVARRIAHEIKNPLTPIQLSAERLRRKYRDDHPPCRRYRPHGRRVLCLRPHARAVAAAAQPDRHRAAERVSAAGRAPRYRVCQQPARGADRSALRLAPDRPAPDQRPEERGRGDPGSRTGRRPADRPDRRDAGRRGTAGHADHSRQRPWPAAGTARAADRALCHHPDERHRARPRHRQEDRRGPWRSTGAGRCARRRRLRHHYLSTQAECRRRRRGRDAPVAEPAR